MKYLRYLRSTNTRNEYDQHKNKWIADKVEVLLWILIEPEKEEMQ